MPKYIGQDYNSKARTSSPIDRVALHKTFEDENPERNELLQDIVDRMNLVLASVREVSTQDASDINYENTDGDRTSVGDTLDALEGTEHVRLHDINSILDHNGIAGDIEDNFVLFDENGLPKDSGISEVMLTIASSTDNAIVRWDGEDGDTIQDSNIIIDDSDNITGVADFTLTGNIIGINNFSIGVADNEPMIVFNDTDGVVEVTGNENISGRLYVGEDDSSRGYINVYGAGAGESWTGAIYIHMSADYDDTVNHYRMQGFQDDLYIGPSNNYDFLTLTAEGVFQVEGEARLDLHSSMGTNDASLATKKYVDDNSGTTLRWRLWIGA